MDPKNRGKYAPLLERGEKATVQRSVSFLRCGFALPTIEVGLSPAGREMEADSSPRAAARNAMEVAS